MASQLWLLRHGDAEPHGVRPEEERVLTERGRRQAQAAGAALRALGVRIDEVFTSPRARARETALLACETFGSPLAPAVYEPLSAGFRADEALALLEERGQGSHIMLVGHEPDLSGVAHELTGARLDLKKGGLIRIDLGDGSGVLRALARPSELALIAGMTPSEV